MNYKKLKKELKKYKAMHFREKEMRDHYESLFAAWVWELKFANCQNELYKELLKEVSGMVKNNLIERIIDNWLEKIVLHKLVHAKNLFNNK